jgi:hypothetical protein
MLIFWMLSLAIPPVGAISFEAAQPVTRTNLRIGKPTRRLYRVADLALLSLTQLDLDPGGGTVHGTGLERGETGFRRQCN